MTSFRPLFPFLHWTLVYIYSRERKLLPILKKQQKKKKVAMFVCAHVYCASNCVQ